MSETTAIEWCDSTFNPWTGCTKVSPGCDHCYAESWAKRSGTVHWGPHAERRRTTAANWRKPLLWNAKRFMQCECGWRGECAAELIGCGACGSIDHLRDVRRRVFCASLADVFDNQVPDEWRRDLFELIGRTQNLDWLLLTKRIGNARAMLNAVVEEMSHGLNTWDERPWPGVWIGATVVNQQEADRDIPKLLATPARVRFLSVEPMLGPIKELPVAQLGGGTMDWVICGGESGPGARPMHPDWARELRDLCAAAGVPFLFKQWGGWCTCTHLPDQTGDSLYTEDLSRLRVKSQAIDHTGATSAYADSLQGGQVETTYRVGKKAAGRMLDGREHNDSPRGFA